MATIIRETQVAADPADVWDALRDFAALHRRLVPGFVVECEVDGDGARTVTFFNGARARELLVGVDDRARRLAYTVVESGLPIDHHHASAQVIAEPDGCRFVWITDVLPDHLAGPIGELMDHGIGVINDVMERSPAGS